MENFDDKYKKKNPFTVPDEYFNGLEDRIMQRIEKQPHRPKTKFMQIVTPYLGLAAIFLIALFVLQVFLPSVIDKDQKIVQQNSQIARTQVEETDDVDIFDSRFNPTSEEIIEYLTSEVDSYELIAGVY